MRQPCVHLRLSAEYELSRLLALKAYYEWSRNVPLVSTYSFPISTTAYGLSLRFTLTNKPRPAPVDSPQEQEGRLRLQTSPPSKVLFPYPLVTHSPRALSTGYRDAKERTR